MPLTQRKGAMLPLAAVSMVGVMGIMALAIDVGSLLRERRTAQTAADAGALAGAHEIFRGRRDLVPASANTETSRNGFTHGSNDVVVTVRIGPATGYFVGDSNFVEVTITRDAPTLFGSLVGRSSATVGARAVAGIPTAANCMYALENSDEKSLNVSSASSLEADCGAVVNSSDSKAVVIESAGTLELATLSVVGGIDDSGGTVTVSGALTTGAGGTADPLAHLQMPYFDPNACDFTDTKIASGDTQALSPGIYCGGLEIDGTANLNPGLYILRGGGIKMGSGRMTGTGVTFINTNATAGNGGADKFQKFEMGSASQATLSAMTTGSLAGVLFYQDPAAGKPGDVYENLIASGSNATFTGILYFPTQPVELGASGSTTALDGGVIATKITVTSNSHVTVTNSSSSISFKRPSLVE